MPRPGRPTTERAKDFKGTLRHSSASLQKTKPFSRHAGDSFMWLNADEALRIPE